MQHPELMIKPVDISSISQKTLTMFPNLYKIIKTDSQIKTI